ncbi:glycosyltransferase family 39 protein [Rhodoferax sp. PAMC 29310]|uniref:ArnT family glycosyltransferase n=1 Tax=Rhodoferax sp. PAMC 29310 TaxID=2822760 RepID=UPI001B339E03|nr:glycosyl transferase [Rhodoferax sp. PAMC 29310]
MPMPPAATSLPPVPRWATLAWAALLLAAVAVYLLGLGGQYVPTNGDELVYTHIARLTAASGHWLPLVSELDHMRNTKPPLLFWQAMVAGNWGANWNLAALRTPSVIYTLLLAGAVAWTVQLITRQWRTALIAAVVYLGFFCTFRFGRTYLTSAPETFWLGLPLFGVLWHRLRPEPASAQADLGWLAHLGFGIAMGMGLAYKSFALIAPAAATLWAAQLLSAPQFSWRTTFQTTSKVSLSALIALGLFGLWFALDPDPSAVWQEFVVGENGGKMSNAQGYWHTALRGGGFSIWAQLLAYVQNAGLLALLVLGVGWVGLRAWWRPSTQDRRPAHLIILLVWLGVWLLVFTLPSQRSARYVIPAMPALAMLIALYWDRIANGWFLASLLLCSVFVGVMGRIAWAAHDVGIGSAWELKASLLATAFGALLLIAGVAKPSWTRACTLASCLLFYASFGLTTAPLNGAAGHYSAQTISQTQGFRIAVPSSFNGQFERFQFQLPGNRFDAYDGENRGGFDDAANTLELARLLESHDAVVWLQSKPTELQPPCLPGCTVLGSRWEVKGRHQSGEITLANVWYPQQWLFRPEWLVSRAGATPAAR